MPDLIERDFQFIYFGTSSQDLLIQSVVRMGLSRNRQILTELSKDQKLEVKNDLELLLSLSFDECNEERALKIRAKFIRNLAGLCQRQESRWSAASHYQKLQLNRFKDDEAKKLKGVLGRKQKLSETGDGDARKSSRLLKVAFDDAENIQQPQDKPCTILPVQYDNVGIIQNPYSMVFTYLICLICIGNEQLSYAERMHLFKRKYTLQKHLNVHIQQGVFDMEFECKHAYCSERVLGITLFKNHAARVHQVFY
ncbi:MAG: hypothetical protein M1813_005546 [Trichoglossum hirsutum]|nr:MAG: hypothetical protein M1813_005546 [Trichoglossum hirsutum]